MKPTTQILALAVTVTCALHPLYLHADDLTPQIKQSQLQQQDVRLQTQRASEELSTIIAEFQSNGLGDGADVKVLQAIRSVLGRLSQDQMQKIITVLGQAQQTPDPNEARQSVVAAFTGQKSIVLQLQQLLLEYQHQQELATLSERFDQLATRQNGNLKSGAAFYRTTKAKSPREYTEAQRTLLQVQLAEQNAINDEVDAQLARLDALVKTVDAPTAQKLTQVIQHADDQKLSDSLKLAADDLTASHFFSALTQERSARETLRDLSRLSAPPKDALSVLQTADEQLTRAIRQQTILLQSTKDLPTNPTELADKSDQLEEQQGDLVDDTDEVSKDLADVTTDPLPDLKSATLEMQRTRAALRPLPSSAPQSAPDHQAAALASLQSAQAKIADQIARLEKLSEAQDILTRVQDLKIRIQTLVTDQQTLAKDTADQKAPSSLPALAALARRQTSLADQDRDLSSLSTSDTPLITKPLQDAAAQMDLAQGALNTRLSSSQAAPAQSLAVDSLKQAEKILDDQLAQLQKDQDDLTALQAARDKLAAALQAQEKVAAESEKAAEQSSPSSATQPGALQPTSPITAATTRDSGTASVSEPASPTAARDAKVLAQEQSTAAKAADETKAALADRAKDAADNLSQAQSKMQTSQTALNQPDPKAAAPAARDALNDLTQAKAALDQKIADLQKNLGQTPDPSEKLEQLAKQIEQAQNDLNNAADPNKAAIADLQQEQQAIATNLDQLQQDGKPVADAARAAQDAANQLAQNDLPAAEKSMQKTAEALQPQDPAATQPAGTASVSEPAKLPAKKTEPQPTAEPNNPNNEPPHAGEHPEAGAHPPGEPEPPHAGEHHDAGEHPEAPHPESAHNSEPGAPEAGGPPHPGEKPTVAQLAQQQKSLQQTLAQLTQQPNSPPTPDANQLTQVAAEITKTAAEDQGALPHAATQSLEQAEAAAAQAAAAAAAHKPGDAQSKTAQAQSALAQAQAAIALAQSGIAQNQNATPNQADPSQHGSDEAANQTGASPSPGDRNDAHTSATSLTAGHNPSQTKATYLALPPRDRAAIQQSHNERYPEEYAPQIEQYLKNLSDQKK